MSHDLEISVNGFDDEERIIVVTDWTLSKGSKGHFYPTYDCGGCPPDPAEINDIECHWQDTGKELTQEEWDRYGATIDEKCWDRVTDEAEASQDDYVDRDYDRQKDRSLETI